MSSMLSLISRHFILDQFLCSDWLAGLKLKSDWLVSARRWRQQSPENLSEKLACLQITKHTRQYIHNTCKSYQAALFKFG